MEVEGDGTAGVHDAVEDDFPEVPAALGHAALTVRPDREPPDRRAGVQQDPDRLAAVDGVPSRVESLDRVRGVLAVEPLDGMGPHAELELQPAGDGLVGDEAQHHQVAVSLVVGKLRHPHA